MANGDQYWMERIAEDPRTKQGLPPTIGASQEEKDAYEAYIRMPLIESGELSTADLPTSYGGRPKGSSRRAMRMQLEWDKAQEQQLQNQRIMQQMEESSARMEEFELEKEAKELEKARQAKVRDEARMIFESIRGGVRTGTDQNGNPTFSDPINPSGQNALFQISNLMGMQHGMENPAARQAVMKLYEDALRSDEVRRTKSQQDELAAINVSVRTQKPMSELGEYTEEGIFKPKPSAIIAGAEQIKAEEEAKQEEKAIAREGRGEEARVKAREESDKRTRRKQLDDDILTEEQVLIDFQNQKQSPSRDTEIKKAEAKLKNLHLRRGAIDGLTSDDLIYKDQDAYKKAIQDGKKIPSGTTIYIGGIPAKVK